VPHGRSKPVSIARVKRAEHARPPPCSSASAA
jgi:hypothetical protein